MNIDYHKLSDNCVVQVATDDEREWIDFANRVEAIIGVGIPNNVLIIRTGSNLVMSVTHERQMNDNGWLFVGASVINKIREQVELPTPN